MTTADQYRKPAVSVFPSERRGSQLKTETKKVRKFKSTNMDKQKAPVGVFIYVESKSGCCFGLALLPHRNFQSKSLASFLKKLQALG